MNRHLLPMIAVIAATGLAGCAGHSESEWHVHLLKIPGSGQVEQQRYLHIMTVSQNDQTRSSPK